MLILGVDPGLRATGYAFLQGLPGGVELVAHGLVRTEDDAPLANRLERIHGALFALLEQRRPSQVAVEDLYATQRYPQLAIEVTALPPAAVKQAIAGFGAASKGQVQAAVQRLLRRPEPFDAHVSDAVAICLTALSRAGVPLRLRAQEVVL